MSAAAFAAVGMLASLSLYGVYLRLGARYDAGEDTDPYLHRSIDDEDTEPWPAPR